MGHQEFKTPEAALAHYGVKGMRWGKRQSARPSNDEIKSARLGLQLRGDNTRKDDPDQVTARYLTKGEKYLAGGLAVSGVATIPIAAAIGVNAVNRKRYQRKVAKGPFANTDLSKVFVDYDE